MNKGTHLLIKFIPSDKEVLPIQFMYNPSQFYMTFVQHIYTCKGEWCQTWQERFLWANDTYFYHVSHAQILEGHWSKKTFGVIWPRYRSYVKYISLYSSVWEKLKRKPKFSQLKMHYKRNPGTDGNLNIMNIKWQAPRGGGMKKIEKNVQDFCPSPDHSICHICHICICFADLGLYYSVKLTYCLHIHEFEETVNEWGEHRASG